MLKADSLSFRYKQNVPLLDKFNFKLQPGEIVGLPGRSGIGKSTLAALLTGYLQPSSGQISCDGQSLLPADYCPAQLIFQHPELAINPRWKIEKILEEGNPNFHSLLHKFGIAEQWLDRYPHELSGGELQRIALIRIMTRQTRFIIADEITASLDANTQALIWTNLTAWAKENQVGILVISHDTNLLDRLCHRIDQSFIHEA